MMIWLREKPWQETSSSVDGDQHKLQTWEPVSISLKTPAVSDHILIFLSAVPPPVASFLSPIQVMALTAALW